MITDIDDYFSKGCGRCDRFATADCSTRRWAQGLLALRRICQSLPLDETVKWGHPCYMHAGRNVALIGAFRGDFRLSFFNAALLQDPQGLLQRQGPNTRHPDMLRFTDPAQVAALAPTVRAYLQEALGHAAAGLKPAPAVRDDPWPDELAEALDADPELADAFHALTPGRQRSYLLHFNGAKKAETRVSRIVAARGAILAGKGAHER